MSGQVSVVKSIFRNLKGVLVIIGCTLSTITCFVPLMALALLKFVLPIRPVRRALTRAIMAIGEFWIDVNSLLFGLVNNTRWTVQGLDGLTTENWYLVIANHQTWVDIVALQTVLNRRIPFLKFFIKQQLIWFPFLGLAWWAMDMPFMKRHSKSYLARHPEEKGKDLEATRRACNKFKTTPTTVINFVEGTRFSKEKHRRRNSQYRHLLTPRAGGVALALSSMGSMFNAILDITIVYPDGNVPQFWGVACGEFAEIVVDIRQLPIEDWIVNGDYENDREFRKQFHQWLGDIWTQKDERIAESHATGGTA